MFGKWYCSYCKENHSRKIPIIFHWNGFWEHSKADFCEEYIMKGNENFTYNKPYLNIGEWISLFETEQIQLARDILNGYSFRRQSNGESIYTKIVNVLRIADGKIIMKVDDEYGNQLDFPVSFLFERYNRLMALREEASL